MRTAVCLDGSVEMELVCEPVFDYGREPAEWALADEEPAHGRRDRRRRRRSACSTDMALGIEGGRVRARHMLREGERLFCSLSWAEGLASPADADDAFARLADDHAVLARVARAARGSPTIASASRSSARRWRSRASPTCRPARPSRR